MRIARMRLLGQRFEEDREDIASTVLQQFVRGLVEGRVNSFNQMTEWDDCLGMVRHMVRMRVADFLRGVDRNLEDAVGDLPETVQEMPEFARGTTEAFTLPELLNAVDSLEPNPPVPQVFRDRFLEGRATDEIAQARGINRNTLVSYYARGLKSLRERLIRVERFLQ